MSRNIKEVIDKPGPLDGILVVEYAVFHAGPGSGAILGDLGAEVIKIEGDIGDPMRHWQRMGKQSFESKKGGNPMFDFSNRNKKGIYLDIKSEKGRSVFERVLKKADVFITNLRQSTKLKLGIDYKSIHQINPRIIYSSVSGYGKKGPASDLGAYDPLGQARSGMMFLTDSDGPAPVQMAILDQSTAITNSHAIMTALYTRERDGIGQEVHNSLYSTALWLMHANLLLANLNRTVKDFVWVRSQNSPLRNNFLCKDEKWIVGTHHPVQKYWLKFCEVTGQKSLVEDPKFIDDEQRGENNEELTAIFDKVFRQKTQAEWVEIFTEAGLMFSPVQQVTDVLHDPQAVANDYVVDFDHPDFGRIKVPGYPIEFSTFSAGIRSASPKLGEHTEQVLRNMAFSEDEIRELKEDGTIQHTTRRGDHDSKHA
jgi:crotonobetainyl-CoA:carnitine CoA-transferase CaiB-like acyl-CoA transferase